MMSRKQPTGLHDLSSNVVMPLGALDPQALHQWADAAGQRFVQVALAGCTDRRAVLQAVGKALALPDWFGANLDALYDSLTDLAAPLAGSGLVLVLSGMPDAAGFTPEDREAVLDVFRDAAEAFAEVSVPLRVIVG
jgi:RNAse (barnase) inhibitor barstar